MPQETDGNHPAAPAKAVGAKRRPKRTALRNWRVRSKLLALIVIPTLAALILGGTRVSASISSAAQYQHINELAVLSGQLADLAHGLELERDLTANFVAQGRKPTAAAEMEAQQTTVNGAVQTVRPAIEDLANSDTSERAEAVQIRNRLNSLPNARKAAVDSQLGTVTVIRLYENTIRDVLSLSDDIDRGAVDEELANGVAAFAALGRAKVQASKERAFIASALAARRMDKTTLSEVLAARAQRDSELISFRSNATIAQRQFYEDNVSGQAVDRAEAIRSRALVLEAEDRPLIDTALGARNGKNWFETSSATIERMRKVEADLAGSIILRSRTLEEAEQRAALITGIGSAVLLLIVIIVTTIMARSLVRPLRRLRGEALQIAGQRLPETVQRLRESEAVGEVHVEPIGVDSEDEIGEVARAFDEVHREAVRLAGEESRLRSNVNAMFVNLSRRSQTLVERQITLIDGLEQGEQDESRLANLFKLDHLATRMRRNSENLLVLAGQDPPRRWSQPVKLVDVARASLSEVENYERVVLQVPDGVSVAGQAVNDVIHLIAELVENALSFSPRETRVTVSGSRIDGGGVMLSVTDSGIGMTQDELVQANERLTDAPTVDVSVSRRMGLFVVARLAHRHGIRVQLRPHGGGGLTAMVLIPESLLGSQPPAYPAGGAAPREEAYASPAPAAAPPVSWPAGGYQPGPGHPSFPSGAYPSSPGDTAGSWPSMPQWPSEAGGWPSEPRTASPATGGSGWPSEPRATSASAGTGYDTSDVWVPARNTGGGSWGEGTGGGLPRRPGAEQPPSWNTGESAWNGFADRGDADTAQHPRYDFPETEAAATGPMPAVKPASAGDEFLPIFASVESAWFDHGDTGASWGSSKADAGWSAAEAVVEPVRDGATASGLPKRVPKANLVPGSADSAAAPKNVAPMPAVSPDRVRSRLSSFQQGFRAARDDISEGKTYSSGPRPVDNREEGA
ncbi:nitrate- and nitrite sensing domain-containing protein [Nonomuraea sp. SMC257]|uniref:histidine kinase n=1 Tax=Nonomuraea montanisoli TaxID=2741721 RepID=A0A7Y6IHU8_9ACTN|nr:nitrate- and nitrite sensing domain-containing protein [Nonomuraea montanisoli]NUW38456.1 nitrate- and nitrite sensing domain-containing protein [Nonomuraea montanisoli]